MPMLLACSAEMLNGAMMGIFGTLASSGGSFPNEGAAFDCLVEKADRPMFPFSCAVDLLFPCCACAAVLVRPLSIPM
eukprot:8260224-Pyramimonas_sp.AAC.1